MLIGKKNFVSVMEAKMDAITTQKTSSWVTGADWKPERCMVAALMPSRHAPAFPGPGMPWLEEVTGSTAWGTVPIREALTPRQRLASDVYAEDRKDDVGSASPTRGRELANMDDIALSGASIRLLELKDEQLWRAGLGCATNVLSH
jgi:hypothetical protein